MAWIEAKIKLGNTECDGMVNDKIVNCPSPESMKGITKCSVNGKSYDIESCVLDERDNFLTIALAMAGANKQEESDDQPAKRRDIT